MKIISNTPEITFDDVLLIPQYSTYESYDELKEVNLRTKISKNIELDVPIVSSFMPGVTEDAMAIAMSEMGGLGFVHSFQSFDRQLDQVKRVKAVGHRVAATVMDQSDKGLKQVGDLLKLKTDLICVFTSHAYNKRVLDFIKKIKKKYPKAEICAGPIVTKEAVEGLAKVGVSSLTVGIGPGSHCTTRLVAGVGRPQLSAIAECAKAAKKYNIPIIADGGVKYAGDIAKALAFGASAVMLGGMLAGTDEAPGELIKKNDKQYKSSWGMCSDTAMSHRHLVEKISFQELFSKFKSIVKELIINGSLPVKKQVAKKNFEEGVEGLIEYKGSVKVIIEDLINASRRSFMYQGVKNIKDLQKKAKVVLVSENTVVENKPRI